MKKIFALFIAGLMLLAAGCSPASTPTAAPTAAPTVAPTATTAATATAAPTVEATATPTAEPTSEPTAAPGEIEKLSLQDLQLVVDGEYYDLQSDVGDLLETLGEDFEIKDVSHGRFSGEAEKQYVFQDITLDTYAADDIDVVYSAEFKTDAFDSARSIHPGSTTDDVKAAYGDGYYEDKGAYVYTFNGKKADSQSSSITFKMKDRVVASVVIYNAGEIQE